MQRGWDGTHPISKLIRCCPVYITEKLIVSNKMLRNEIIYISCSSNKTLYFEAKYYIILLEAKQRSFIGSTSVLHYRTDILGIKSDHMGIPTISTKEIAI